MLKLNKSDKAVPGKSLAGFKINEDIEKFLPLVEHYFVNEEWTIDIQNSNRSVTLYEFPNREDFYIYFHDPEVELYFCNRKLVHILAGKGYEGELFEGNVKIGSQIREIKQDLILDEAEEVHYLMSVSGKLLDGICFMAGGYEVEEDPEAIITQVKVFKTEMLY